MNYYLDVHSVQIGEAPKVATAASVFKKMCYENREKISAGIIVAGYDKYKGGQVCFDVMCTTCVCVCVYVRMYVCVCVCVCVCDMNDGYSRTFFVCVLRVNLCDTTRVHIFKSS